MWNCVKLIGSNFLRINELQIMMHQNCFEYRQHINLWLIYSLTSKQKVLSLTNAFLRNS
jgi:hypothetical protein